MGNIPIEHGTPEDMMTTEMLTVAAAIASLVVATLAYAYLVVARPRVLCFYDIPHISDGEAWHVMGYIVHVANTGRAPALLRSAGLKSGDGHQHRGNFPEKLAMYNPAAHFPLILQPGQVIQVFVAVDDVPDPSAASFGALELRYGRRGRRKIYHVAKRVEAEVAAK